MVHNILTGAGFVLNETYKESRFLTPPSTTYAVYHDACERRGGDNINLITDHDITIELYEPAPDPAAEKAIENQLDAKGIEFSKQPRYWMQEEQLYQVIYDFGYTKKEAQ